MSNSLPASPAAGDVDARRVLVSFVADHAHHFGFHAGMNSVHGETVKAPIVPRNRFRRRQVHGGAEFGDESLNPL